MKHPITDKAQVSIDFPDKFYVGSFGRNSSLDVTADDHARGYTVSGDQEVLGPRSFRFGLPGRDIIQEWKRVSWSPRNDEWRIDIEIQRTG